MNEWLAGCPADLDGYRAVFAEPARLATTVIVALGHEPTAPVVGDFMPFRYTVAMPTEILMGRLHGAEMWNSFGLQLAWTVAFYFIGRALFARGVKQYTGFGN